MPTAYTSLLGLALPVTGELSGTWGDTVNDYITKYLDSSVAGTQTISGSQTAVTLTRANGGALSPVGSGSTGSSQYQIINCTGNPAGTLTITVDVSTGTYALSNSTYSQTFAVINATSTSQSVVVRATTTTGTSTGVTLVAGEKAVIAWNGSDFIKVATSAVDGVSTISFGTTGLTPSTATSGAVTVAGTLATTNGGTGLTSFTANGVVYASSSSALTTGSALTFDGTNLSTALGGAYYSATSNYGFGTPDSAGLQIFTASGDSIRFGTRATGTFTELARLNATGLGIGTSSPAAKLQVNQTLSSGTAISVVGSSANTVLTSDYASLFLQNTNTTNGNYNAIGFVNDQGGYSSAIYGVYTSHTSGAQSGELAFSTRSAGTFAERMRLDSSGNLGLGVTPSAGTSGKVFQITNAGHFMASGPTVYIDANAYFDSGWKYITTAAASNYYQNSGAHIWQTAPSGTAGNAISFTQAMTLDSSGNLGIGTSSPAQKLEVNGSAYLGGRGSTFAFMTPDWRMYNSSSGNAFVWDNYSTEMMRLSSAGNLGLGVTPSAWYTGFKSFQAGATTALADFSSGTYLFNNWYIAASGANTYLTSNFASSYSQVSGEHRFYNAPSGTAGNTISFTQAMTLDASGNLGVGTTSPNFFGSGTKGITVNGSSGSHLEMLSNGASLGFLLANNNGLQLQTNSNNPLIFNTNNTERARITSTGTFQLTNNYQEGVLTANTGTAYTIDLVNGTLQILTLTGNCTFTFPTATAGQSFTMLLRQDGTGGRTVTWPAAVRWPGNTAPTITSTASQTDKYIFTADGTRWYGSNAGQAYVA